MAKISIKILLISVWTQHSVIHHYYLIAACVYFGEHFRIKIAPNPSYYKEEIQEDGNKNRKLSPV